mmetsp:Transcript_20032/g.35754  ORF Transcript_20032/g.35754 Transcript_20032/m.35754 type:complete len:210 (+) Transcript_20032:114-743(+)
MPHRRAPMGAVPRLVHGAEVADDGRHLALVQGPADHDGLAARPGGEHGGDLAGPAHDPGPLPQQADHLLDVVLPEGDVLADGKGRDVHPLLALGGLSIFLETEVEAVGLEDIKVLLNDDLVGSPKPAGLGHNKRLGGDDGRAVQLLEIVLLVRRVLVNDEQVTPPQARYDEALIELPDDSHFLEIPLRDPPRQLLFTVGVARTVHLTLE